MNRDKLNILFLNKFYYLKGGSERIFFEEMALLEKRGHKVIPYSRRNPNNIPTEYDHFFAPEFRVDKGLSYQSLKSVIDIIYSNSTRKHLKKLLSKEHPHIAHAHNIYGILSTSVLDELFANGIPAVLSLHDYKIICPNYQFLNNARICEDCKTHRYYKAIQNKCVHGNLSYSIIYALENYFNFFKKKYKNKILKYIAVSKFIKNKFVEYGFPEKQIVVIPNFINTDKYIPTYENKNYFLYFGRLSKEKGIQTLIDAFKLLRRLDFKLKIVGEGPLLDDLKKMVVGENTGNIELTGFLTGKQLEDAIKQCTCVITPSEWYENCPMSILESFAYGKPVIGADIGGIPELIEDGANGKIFRSGDSNDLALKMYFMANLPEKAIIELGRNSRRKVEEQYNQDLHYNALTSLYKSVIN